MSAKNDLELGGQLPRTISHRIDLAFQYRAARPAVEWAESASDIGVVDWTQHGDARAFSVTKYVDAQDQLILKHAQPIIFREPIEKQSLGYPRLTRSHPYVVRPIEASRSVVHEIAYLWKYAKRSGCEQRDSMFRGKVISAVARVGLLDPSGRQDTLSDWLRSAWVTALWLEYLKNLDANKDGKGLNQWKLLEEDFGQRVSDYWVSDAAFQEHTTAMESLISKTENLNDLKLSLSRYFMQTFLERATSQLTVNPEGAIGVSCGSLDWAFFDLSKLYGAGTLVACQCGSMIAPEHGNTVYCSNRCEERYKKRRARARFQKVDA
jgi:hypothetical protein